MSVAIEESVAAVREVVAYDRQEWQIAHFDNKFQQYYQAVMKEQWYKVKILFLSEPFLYGTKLVVILFGGMIMMKGAVSLGEFVVSFTLVDQLVTAIGKLFQQGLTGKRLVASVNCVQEIMAKEVITQGTVAFTEDIAAVQLHNVTFSYTPETEPVLDDLSIDFPVGKKIALVGASGSGKSTIAQLLLRMYGQKIGEVTVNNIPVHHYDDQYTSKVSVVFQEPHFIPTSIRENLTFGQAYKDEEIERVCKEMLCHDFIQAMPRQYETEVGERGVNLSGGQKQRLALSRALLKNADVLILDEATSALDVETEYRVQQNIDKLRKGKTTIVIAHRLSTIQNADVIYLLDKGRVVAQGTHDVLMGQCPAYQALYA